MVECCGLRVEGEGWRVERGDWRVEGWDLGILLDLFEAVRNALRDRHIVRQLPNPLIR